jgi:hypothetical protein
MSAANDNYPLVLTRAEAADMCRLTPSGFDAWVRKGIVPPALHGTRRWSRDAIRDAINGKVAAVDVGLDPYEKWKAENARKNRA